MCTRSGARLQRFYFLNNDLSYFTLRVVSTNIKGEYRTVSTHTIRVPYYATFNYFKVKTEDTYQIFYTLRN